MEHPKYSINSYTCNDVYCEVQYQYQHHINVPFSWEYKPGLSKVIHHNGTKHTTKLVLQPPPCSSYGNERLRVEDTQIPLGLCAVQTSLRISSFRMEEDPFVEAYKKCTKSPFMLQGTDRDHKNNGSRLSIRKYMHIFSCKYSGDVCVGKVVHNNMMGKQLKN